MEYAVIEYGDLEIRDAEEERMKDVEALAKDRPPPDTSLLNAARDPFHRRLDIDNGSLGICETREVSLPRIVWLWLEGVGMVKQSCASRSHVVEGVLLDAAFELSKKIMDGPVPMNVATEEDWANGYEEEPRSMRREELSQRKYNKLCLYADIFKDKLRNTLKALRDARRGTDGTTGTI